MRVDAIQLGFGMSRPCLPLSYSAAATPNPPIILPGTSVNSLHVVRKISTSQHDSSVNVYDGGIPHWPPMGVPDTSGAPRPPQSRTSNDTPGAIRVTRT